MSGFTIKEINVQIGDRLKKVRKILGLNQDELAKSIGLTRTSIVNIEKGRQSLTIDTLFKIVNKYNVGVNDLFPMDSKINLVLEYQKHELQIELQTWKDKYNNLVESLNNIKEHLTV